jgi:uncharacterized protein YdbL (DUF1318 family)
MKALRLLLLFGLCLSSPVWAQDDTPDAIRKRMEANLPKIDALKKSGKVGETNRGYLEARGTLEDAQKELVKTENADRKSIYQTLAKRANATLEEIERTRAELIRRRSTAGVWLQDASGKWYQK